MATSEIVTDLLGRQVAVVAGPHTGREGIIRGMYPDKEGDLKYILEILPTLPSQQSFLLEAYNFLFRLKAVRSNLSECGCRIVDEHVTQIGSGHDLSRSLKISYCSMHAAVGEMIRLLKRDLEYSLGLRSAVRVGFCSCSHRLGICGHHAEIERLLKEIGAVSA